MKYGVDGEIDMTNDDGMAREAWEARVVSCCVRGLGRN